MRVDVHRYEPDGFYGVEFLDTTGERPKLVTIKDGLESEDDAIREGVKFIEERGAERGDEVFGLYGLIYHYNGKRWRVDHVSGY